jgi:hypothetical protein
MSDAIGRAQYQVSRVTGLCDFLGHPGIQEAVYRAVPVSMPTSVGSLGFDVPFWMGLGIVGLWSALDAFAERAVGRAAACSQCGRKCLHSRLTGTGKVAGVDATALAELEDLRHLYAHNFAGHADATYFLNRRRHLLAPGLSLKLSSGAIFDGERLALDTPHLRYYTERVASILRLF